MSSIFVLGIFNFQFIELSNKLITSLNNSGFDITHHTNSCWLLLNIWIHFFHAENHVVIHVVNVVIIAVCIKLLILQSDGKSVHHTPFTKSLIKFHAASCNHSCIFSSNISVKTVFIKNFQIIFFHDSFLQILCINVFHKLLHFHNNISFGLTNSSHDCAHDEKKLYANAQFSLNHELIHSM